MRGMCGETASRYSHQQTSSDLETVNISGEEVVAEYEADSAAQAAAEHEAEDGELRAEAGAGRKEVSGRVGD